MVGAVARLGAGAGTGTATCSPIPGRKKRRGEMHTAAEDNQTNKQINKQTNKQSRVESGQAALKKQRKTHVYKVLVVMSWSPWRWRPSRPLELTSYKTLTLVSAVGFAPKEQ